jgi:hypothetical protein
MEFYDIVIGHFICCLFFALSYYTPRPSILIMSTILANPWTAPFTWIGKLQGSLESKVLYISSFTYSTKIRLCTVSSHVIQSCPFSSRLAHLI